MNKGERSKKNRKVYRFFTDIDESNAAPSGVMATVQAHNSKEAKEKFEFALGRKIISMSRE